MQENNEATQIFYLKSSTIRQHL